MGPSEYTAFVWGVCLSRLVSLRSEISFTSNAAAAQNTIKDRSWKESQEREGKRRHFSSASVYLLTLA